MSEKRLNAVNKNRTGSELIHFLLLTANLFIFWFVLSGMTDLVHLLMGLVSAVAVTIVTRPLLLMPWGADRAGRLPAWDLPWLRLFTYWPWLAWQIIQANLQVALLVLHPRMPIKPQLVRFRKPLPGSVAHMILANSITLTPGTITVDLEGDEYIVHALSDEAARSLLPSVGEGEMQRRVGAVFEEQGKVTSERR